MDVADEEYTYFANDAWTYWDHCNDEKDYEDWAAYETDCPDWSDDSYDDHSDSSWEHISSSPEYENFEEDFVEYKLQEASAPKIEVDKSHPLFEKKIVITGFRNKDLENNILSKGGEIATSVSKNTFIVIAKDPEDESGKVLQAKEKNIPIMSMDTFNTKFFN